MGRDAWPGAVGKRRQTEAAFVNLVSLESGISRNISSSISGSPHERRPVKLRSSAGPLHQLSIISRRSKCYVGYLGIPMFPARSFCEFVDLTLRDQSSLVLSSHLARDRAITKDQRLERANVR